MCSLVALAARRSGWLPLAAVWMACAVTHPLLDMLTDGGSGVMLLAPWTGRLSFPWRPIRVSPLGITAFFGRAGGILGSEAPFDAAALALGLAARLWRRRR